MFIMFLHIIFEKKFQNFIPSKSTTFIRLKGPINILHLSEPLFKKSC